MTMTRIVLYTKDIIIGEKRGRFFTVAQVEIIFNKLGMPYRIKVEI